MNRVFRILAMLAAVMLAASCDYFRSGPERPSESGLPYDNVAIYYSIGYNNLKTDIDANIRSLCKNRLPLLGSSKALVMVQHQSVSDYDWRTPTSPMIIQLSADLRGAPRLDTLAVLEKGTFLTEKETMTKALNFIHEHFEAAHYGLLFSSHGTGWLPEGYYDNGEAQDDWSVFDCAPRNLYHVRKANPSGLRTKTFGCEARYDDGVKVYSHEMELSMLAASIPYHMDYIIFDACLMGCVEVAYELRNCASVIAFSQTETLTSGWDYAKIASRLLGNAVPDPIGASHDFFEMYDRKSGASRSATVSAIRTDALKNLAETCRPIFLKYRPVLSSMEDTGVQRYFRGSHTWFYDLRDILRCAGATDSELASVDAALSKAVIYKAATPEFMGDIKLENTCGFSMFLPSKGSEYLRNFYTGLAWNEDTGLVD